MSNSTEATEFYTTDPEKAVKLRIGKDAITAKTPISIPDLLKSVSNDYPDSAALSFKKESDKWQSLTYRQYRENVLHTAKAFIKVGLEPRKSVAVMGFNSPEWFYSDLAAIHAGGIIAGIYTTNSAEAAFQILSGSSANIVVVDDAKQMAKIRQIYHQLPLLKAAIQINGPFEDYVLGEEGYYTWSDLMAENLDEFDDELQRRLDNIKVNECNCLVYTSGTTGLPKGVMISHDSMTWNAKTMGNHLGMKPASDVLVSFLPLNHIAGHMADIVMSITFAAHVYFADREALRGSLLKTLTEVRPTIFFAVPRVFEKIHEKLKSLDEKTTGIKKTLMDWTKHVFLKHWENIDTGSSIAAGLQYKTAKFLVGGIVRKALGLDRCHGLMCGAAPVSIELKRYFLSLDIPIVETFGMSESSGCHCISSINHYNPASTGRALPGLETTILNPDESGTGEVLLRGRHVFMGYINDPEKTAETLDEDGWLHTGDVGKIDENGSIYITGRIKEILITAGGENVPPAHIELLVKNELSALSNTFLVGDKRKFLTMLVTLKTETDVNTGAPTDNLHSETLAFVQELGFNYEKLTEIIDAGPCPKVLGAITEAVTRANGKSISNAQKVQKFAILPHDFSVPTGELGPTLKVKRNVVVEKYADVIEKFYQ